jgi:hypothetical protein
MFTCTFHQHYSGQNMERWIKGDRSIVHLFILSAVAIIAILMALLNRLNNGI